MPKQFLNINDFSGGINTVKNPRDLANNEAVEIENFDLSNRGELKPGAFFHKDVDGTAVILQSNNVPKHVASINAGHGLFYFEADDPTAVRGVTITANGASGTIADGPDGNGKYTLAFFDTNKIFINEADSFWINNGLISSDGEGVIRVSGTLNNDGVYTVKNVSTILNGATPDITSTNSHTISGNLTQCQVEVEEVIVTELVADGTSVTIGAEGFVGDNFLALGNIDDNKIDIYADSADAFSSDAIANIYTNETQDVDSSPIFNYYYADSILRVSDANFKNKAKTKWYGKIDKQILSYFKTQSGLVTDAGKTKELSRTIPNKFYEEENDLAKPSDVVFKASGDVDGSVEFPAGGAGWGLSVLEGTEEGSWESATYEFAGTFIYDDNQESLLRIFKTASGGATRATFTNTSGFKELIFNVYAKEDLSVATDTGGATPDTVQANGAVSVGDTQITVEGNSAVDNFSVDDVVTDQFRREIGVIKTVDSATQITLRAGALFGIGNDDPLFKRANYPNRISGGRIYIRKTNTTDDWILFADIDITKGVRVSLRGEYNPWVQDNSTNSFRVTSSLAATTRNATDLSDTNWVLRAADPNLDTYSSINGFSQNTTQIAFGKSGAGFKTATVCNRRAFVANIKYNVSGKAERFGGFVFNHFGDRIMFSEIGKYDTFPNTNFIDVTVGDGEDYVRLESFGDRLLCFKQRTLQILNVASNSPVNWFIEDTVQFAGVHYPYNVCKGEVGVVFANQNGLFLYNVNGVTNLTEGKIEPSGWRSSFGSGRRQYVVGYEPLQDQIVVLDRASFCQHGYIYNLKTQSFSYGEYLAPNAHSSLANASSFEPVVTNFVNDSTGQLIISYDTGSLDIGNAGANTVHTTKYDSFNTGASDALTSCKLVTKDFVLANTATLAKVYKLYIHYRSTLDVTVTAAMIYYQIDQSGTWVAFNSGSMPRSLNTGNAYDIAVFTPSAPFECQSIAIKIDSTVTTQLFINDMQIEYRELRKRVS